ncbi:MAG: AMP-binding protein, partial [bacterium]|nr:AMP-binding protein [bacterium]
SELPEKFRELGITVADLPAGYWQRWVEESLAAAESAPLRPLRLVSVGGDVMAPEAACGWSRTPQTAVGLVNAYGPTEATITATTFQVPAASPERCCRHRVPIGRPLAGRSLRILDRRGLPVAIGVPGELCLGGTLLARGYLKRPALTAERFVPDPFAAPRHPGARLYRTGDLACYRSDGHVEFLGRLDQQVKVRGFRIELGEIETVLGRHPAVQEAVVGVRRQEATSARRLVACVVAVRTPSGRVPTTGELQGFIKQNLPEYMVPSAFVFLESLPLMPGGKVDRTALSRLALPAPEDRDHLGSAFVAPANPTEKVLAEIWAEVLGGRRVGVDDNFLELGGDSILSIQVVSRARQEGLIFTPREVFEQPTLGDLAAVVTAATGGVNDQGPVTGELPLTPVQRWFFECRLPAPHHFNQALLLEARESLEPAWLERALALLLEHHDAL